jgi:hypothetical protein
VPLALRHRVPELRRLIYLFCGRRGHPRNGRIRRSGEGEKQKDTSPPAVPAQLSELRQEVGIRLGAEAISPRSRCGGETGISMVLTVRSPLANWMTSVSPVFRKGGRDPCAGATGQPFPRGEPLARWTGKSLQRVRVPWALLRAWRTRPFGADLRRRNAKVGKGRRRSFAYFVLRTYLVPHAWLKITP